MPPHELGSSSLCTAAYNQHELMEKQLNKVTNMLLEGKKNSMPTFISMSFW